MLIKLLLYKYKNITKTSVSFVFFLQTYTRKLSVRKILQARPRMMPVL